MSSIQSPLHSHVLFVRNLSQHYLTAQQEILSENETLLECEICREDIINGSTSIYCCEHCWYYIHTSCARSAPLQIQHPHHEHPLDLQQGPNIGLLESCYRCVHGCEYELRAGYAMRSLQVEKYYCSMLREASNGESRLQCAHEHPLTTVPVRTRISCGGCETRISEEACGCSECNFFLHEACAKAPLEIQHHPFHPKHPLYLSYDSSGKGKCHACRSPCYISPIRYRCEECELIFDLSCVISTMPRENDDDDGEREDISRRPSVIDHPLHPHQLSSYHSKTQTYITCRICIDWISSENFFGCLDCSFFLHGSCAQPPTDAIQHYLHPEHTPTFAQCPDEKKPECAICESQVGRNSYCYTCQLCKFFIHSFCASATLSDLEKGVATTVQYSFHEHELKLYCTSMMDFCTVCRGRIGHRTPAYRCFSKGCDFKLHKSCLQLSSHLVHPSHSLHALTLCFLPRNKDTVCRRCNRIIYGTFAFSCGECNFYLHVDCAQKPNLKHPFHEHHLFYFMSDREIINYEIAEGDRETKKDEIIKGWEKSCMCRACRKSCSIDFFSCQQCHYSLHYECSQLPLTIKSEHHCYCEPLVLRKSFIEDERAEYYCDICERRRDPKKWVYFCESCDYNFVAHVECALSQVKLEVIEEDEFIRGEEDIQRQEQEIRVAQEQGDTKRERLRPLMEELESMRAKVVLQRLELKEQKAEHAKWIDMRMIEEDESIGGEEDVDSTYGKSKKLKAILEKLETEQASWLTDFLKTECDLPTAFFSN